MLNLERPFFTKKYLLLSLFVTIGYSLLFLSTFSMLSRAAGTFLVFPILLVAWLCGVWRGVLYTLFILTWHVFLLAPLVGLPPSEMLTDRGFVTAVFANLFITVLVGYLHELRTRLQQQIEAKTAAEQKIRALNESLETHVYQQTIELRENEARFRNLAENSPDIIYVVDVVKRKTVYFNHQEFLGYRQEEFTNPTFLEKVLNPDDKERVISHWQEVIKGKSPPPIEYRIKNKAGNWDWIQSRDVILSYRKGRMPHTIMIILSIITERKKIEVALRESEARWEFALEGSGDGVWDWHINSGHVFFSPQWKNMLGYDASELSDTHESWEALVHPEDLPQVQKEINNHLQRKTAVYTAEYRIKHKSGNYIWVLARGKFLRDESETGRTHDWYPYRHYQS